MPEPITDDDQDQTVTTASNKKVVLPPPLGQSSPLYNAEPADAAGNDSPYTTTFLKRFAPKNIDAASSSIEALTRQNIAEQTKADNLLNDRLERDRAQQKKAFDAESAAADAIPPAWNADQERQARVRTPLENFGSIGAIFCILASQFTKTPMTSAMNAAAAAITAQTNHDEEGYKTAYAAWKDNTALALKRFGMERDVFEDANKFADSDIQDWKVKTLQAAAQFNNQKVIAMLDAGLPPGEIIDYMDKYSTAADKLAKAAQDQEVIEGRRQALTGLFAAQAENNPQLFGSPGPDGKYGKPPNPYKAAVARNALMQAYQYDAKTPAEMDFKQWMIDQLTTKGSLDPKEMDAKVQEMKSASAVAEDWAAAKTLFPDDVQKQADWVATQQAKSKSSGRPTKESDVQNRLEAWKAAQIANGHTPSEAEIEAKDDSIRREVATASAAPKSITTLEQKTLTAAPSLMKHLATLDAFSSATGTISGLVQRLGAEYGGVNDPAIIWQTAKRQAEAAVAELAAGGRISVTGLKAQLEQLPDDYKAARFGKYQVQQFMADLRDKSQSELDIIQAEGKDIPQDVLDKFAAIGVYPASQAAKDPLLQLHKDPAKVTDEALLDMSHYMSALSLPDQQAIIKEAKRRKVLETQQNSPN